MGIGNKNKSLIFPIVIVFLVLGGLIYFFGFKYNSPYQVISPKNYPAGTKISLYEGVPPGFPSGIILENKELSYSGTVTSKSGKTKITVSYISDTKVPALTDMYEASLDSRNWEVSVIASTQNAVTIQAKKRAENLLVSISNLEDKVMVTFQYEK